MKLKSKLIATIVSICAAIAVMGVGVWAATESFQVTVTNQVNIAVTNFSGKITVKSSAQIQQNGESALRSAGYTELGEGAGIVIFDSSETAENKTATIAATGAEHTYAGADLFTMDKIDGNTVGAQLTYTFVYEAAGAGAGKTQVTIDPSSLPMIDESVDASMAYTYRVVDTGITGNLTQGTDVVLWADSGVSFTIEIIATYTNEEMVSVVLQGSGATDLEYVFAINYETVSQVDESGATEIVKNS